MLTNYFLALQDDLDSGYHTADGSLRDDARGFRSIEARPRPPGEYTLTRQELRRNIEEFNNNNFGLIMTLVRNSTKFYFL